MKVIDLLVKIANGEEVPKKVFYKTNEEYTGGYYWNYDEGYKDYKDSAGDYVFTQGHYHVIDMLNIEVEIIEEDKKIEKLECKTIGDMVEVPMTIDLVDKINEIIDKLNMNKEE